MRDGKGGELLEIYNYFRIKKINKFGKVFGLCLNQLTQNLRHTRLSRGSAVQGALRVIEVEPEK